MGDRNPLTVLAVRASRTRVREAEPLGRSDRARYRRTAPRRPRHTRRAAVDTPTYGAVTYGVVGYR